MMRYSFTIFLLLLTVCSFAQLPAKVYRSIQDYNDHISLDENINIDMLEELPLPPDCNYDIYSAEDVSNIKALKKRCILVSCNGNLYINCSIIRYKWFVPAIYVNEQYIYFRAYMSRLKEHEMQMHLAGQKTMYRNGGSTNAINTGLTFGAAGILTSELPKEIKTKSQRYNYAIDRKTGKVYVINIPFMQDLLEPYPELDKQYMKKGHPEDIQSIIRYLKAADRK